MSVLSSSIWVKGKFEIGLNSLVWQSWESFWQEWISFLEKYTTDSYGGSPNEHDSSYQEKANIQWNFHKGMTTTMKGESIFRERRHMRLLGA